MYEEYPEVYFPEHHRAKATPHKCHNPHYTTGAE